VNLRHATHPARQALEPHCPGDLRLAPAARFLVSAHYLGGQKYEDLAHALDLPVGTVKTHLHRAKRRLRAILEAP
jgi:DNA-directed RNA polymerase specialized sigma24 family protein